MIYNQFQDLKLSMLGFGTMRLPLTGAQVDEAQVAEMTRLAIENGVNYFDTAYPYHGGQSETIIGKALKAYPREAYYLATKYPGHQIAKSYDPAAIFEEQLQKCGVDYFDFYLLHNVYENSIKTYKDQRWGIIDYFVEQRRLGRIKHLGFSTHAGLDTLRAFLDEYGEEMEFCQIQLNYLDWTLQQALEKYALLSERKLPVIVMEPLRGGRLCTLKPQEEETLRALRPEASMASWALRFLQGLPNVAVVLSGMSNLEQMEENIQTFAQREPLTAEENAQLLALAEGMKNNIPCTGCRYCCDGCPKGLDIPMLLSICNEMRFAPAVNVGMRVEALPEDKRPAACIACGKCVKICPQNINIPSAMQELTTGLSKLPSWAEICRQRDEAQKH